MNNDFSSRLRRLPLAVLAATCALPALATQGTFPHGYGVKSEGMGGVGIALAQDGLAGATNPAGMVRVGNRFDVGAAFLSVDNGSRFAGTTYDATENKGLYIIPQLGANYMIDADSSVGVSVVGNGVGTAYSRSANVGGMQGPRSQLQQMVATFSYARKLGEAHSVGAGLVLARQALTIRGPASIGLPEGHDSSYGAGVRLGWSGQLTPELTVGATYASKVSMGKLDRFKGLLAEGGDMDVPANYGIGAAYKLGATTLAADVMRIEWGEIRSLANPGVTNAGGPPGSANGPGFGWRNQSVWRVGVDHALSEALTLRAGYNQGTRLLNPRDTYLGVLAPSANRRHVTVGASYQLGRDGELSLAYARSIKGTTQGTGAPPDGLTDLYMGQDWLSVSYGMRF